MRWAYEWGITWRKNLSARYYLGFVKYGISLGGFKSETSLEENCKCLLQSINPSVKFEGLVWKPCYSRTSILGLKLKKTFGEAKGLIVQREDIKSEKM